MNCFFCDTQTKEDPQIFLTTENFFARFDDFPLNPGHCEIIPKEHITSFFDLRHEQIGELFELVPLAYNIGINDGIEAGRTVPHLHIHLIPRYRGDVTDPRGGVRNIIPNKANYIDSAMINPTKRVYFEQ